MNDDDTCSETSSRLHSMTVYMKKSEFSDRHYLVMKMYHYIGFDHKNVQMYKVFSWHDSGYCLSKANVRYQY